MPSSLADAIDLAIDQHLWDGTIAGTNENKASSSYSAILRALRFKLPAHHKACTLLRSLGYNPDALTGFDEIELGEKRQYARALWLTWSAMIAREEER